MANDEHVALLKQGVTAWNAWRDENPDVRPDLSRASLREASLAGANLRGANLSATDLTWADLRDANLVEANLHGTKLSAANPCRRFQRRAGALTCSGRQQFCYRFCYPIPWHGIELGRTNTRLQMQPRPENVD
jgi:hypothetical protein